MKRKRASMKRETNIEVNWALDDIVAVHGIVSKTVRWDTSWDVYGDVSDVVFAPQDPHWVLINYGRDPEHPSLDKFLKGPGSGE
jgi:hypothetical protein